MPIFRISNYSLSSPSVKYFKRILFLLPIFLFISLSKCLLYNSTEKSNYVLRSTLWIQQAFLVFPSLMGSQQEAGNKKPHLAVPEKYSESVFFFSG